MAKTAVQFLCQECGWSGSKWYGRCPECKQWGTIEEFKQPQFSRSRNSTSTSSYNMHSLATSAQAQSLQEVDDMQSEQRISTGFQEFDRVLGGGIVPGSVTLIAGEPGIGKSTLLLQTASNIAQQNNTVLYISGEESTAQIRMRANRINAHDQTLLVSSTTDLTAVTTLISQEKPALAIVDSAQTIASQDVDGIFGGSTQVREVASQLIDVAKNLTIPILLVGHVTKDGSIAGPRTLEHLVDVVCQIEGDNHTSLRLLHASKNRFGPTDEIGCFDMSGEGIEEVLDPSGLFMSTQDMHIEGTCITFTLEGRRSLPIEVQSLITSTVLPTPRRAVNGVDTNRIAMLCAVLYRHGNINVLNKDLYVSTVAGGVAKEPACDLAIVASIASANQHKKIAKNTCAIGEISLTGQVRPAPQMTARLREAARLGFKQVITAPLAKPITIPDLNIMQVRNIKEALQALLP
ncbi:MAG: DNA repair protein RadA [Bifidobacteriaceae bacterium]|nr:DNA repair protein RadA [Bifidobacteriaceae bacterium]